ncbi:hypothetical protein ATANTOWER_030374, partial [Ataeniobius toweri]|nr:hypothetical protein [Ataeniobius toweri]
QLVMYIYINPLALCICRDCVAALGTNGVLQRARHTQGPAPCDEGEGDGGTAACSIPPIFPPSVEVKRSFQCCQAHPDHSI